MKATNKALDIIKHYESFFSKPYLCPRGIPTIGYGSTYYENGTKVTLNDAPITEQRANELMQYKVDNEFGAFINQVVKTTLNQNQFDALVSFVYNIGIGEFKTSTILKLLNVGDFKSAADEFPKWNKSGGKVLNGLVSRRKSEQGLFLA